MSTTYTKSLGVLARVTLAWFPWTARRHDLVYVFYGGEFPFVLRPTKKEKVFQLVGQCYVHGVMELDQLSLDTFEPEDVWLGGSYEVEFDEHGKPT